jgi:hypothetical protein
MGVHRRQCAPHHPSIACCSSCPILLTCAPLSCTTQVELQIPLAAFDDEDAAAARTAPPELALEFYGMVIRTGYTTPPLTATLDRGDVRGKPPALAATVGASMCVPLTDLAQRLGPQRLVLAHVIMQVVAVFGTRRVIVGATVLSMDTAFNDAGKRRECTLLSCGVDAGATLTLEAALRDSGSRANLLGAPGAGMRKSIDKGRDRAATRFMGAKGGDGAKGLSLWRRSQTKLKMVALLSDRSDVVVRESNDADVESPACSPIPPKRVAAAHGDRKGIVSTAI